MTQGHHIFMNNIKVSTGKDALKIYYQCSFSFIFGTVIQILSELLIFSRNNECNVSCQCYKKFEFLLITAALTIPFKHMSEFELHVPT